MARKQARFRWDDFVLDLGTYRLERDGRPLAVEPKALDVLALLVGQPDHLFTKQEIFDAVWPDTAVTDHALTRVIAQLRRALGDDSKDARYIETVPTRGYRWIRPVTLEPVPLPVPLPAPLPAPGTAQAPEIAPAPTLAIGLGPPPAPVVTERAPAPAWWRGRTLALLLVGVAAAGTVTAWALGVFARVPASGGAAPAAAHPFRWPVQWTTHAGLDLHPAVSPRGDALAFASDRSGALELYVRSLADGASEAALTADDGFNVQPAWSPDGTRIAYHSYRRGGVWVVPARGGAPRQVAAEGSNPSWSPDGRRLAYQSDEHTDVTPSAFGAQAGSVLWIVDADGQNARPLTRAGEPPGGHASPIWSPDGRYIAFTVFESFENTGAWLLDVATGRTREIKVGAKLYELAFAPDGTALYAAGGEALVHRLPFDAAQGTITGPAEPMAIAGVPGVRGLSISPDGGRLYFAGLALSSQIWAQRVDEAGAALGEPYALTADTSRRNSMAVVSPDGRRVAYMSTRQGQPPSIWLVNSDATGRVQLTGDEDAEGKPAWFPDGRRLAFLGNRGETVGLWALDLETRRETLLLESPPASPLAWRGMRPAEMQVSPSMRQLAFVVLDDAGQRRLLLTGLDPFEPRPLSDPSQWVGYPAWAPDERRLAAEVKIGSSTHAAVIDVATGTLRQVTRERGQTWVNSWSPDGRRLAVAVQRDGTWGLRSVDVDSGREAVMLPQGPANVYVRYPDWSRAGGLVVYERGELRGNIWMLPLR